MGGHPYWYTVPYQANVQAALNELREREFRAGRYYPAMELVRFPITADSPAPGAQHTSIEEAQEDADATGTCSILDILTIADEPDFCVAAPLDPSELQALYGTIRPSAAQVESNMDFLEDVERGHAVYIVCYEDDSPSHLVFAGYSFD